MDENNQKNKIILAVIVVLAIAAIIVAAVVSSNKKESKTASTATSASQTAATEAPKVTPTFMYFLSSSDSTYLSDMAMAQELQNEYAGKINFDIRDIGADPSKAEGFELVVGQTPSLIMLNTSNDISAIEFQCADKAKLTEDIETALK